SLVLAGRPDRRSGAPRVLALLVVDRRTAVLIATREDAFPGEAVFHEKLVRPRPGGLLASSEPSRDRQHARDTGDCDRASTHWNGRLRHARSDSSVTSKRAYVSADGASSPTVQFTICPKNLSDRLLAAGRNHLARVVHREPERGRPATRHKLGRNGLAAA